MKRAAIFFFYDKEGIVDSYIDNLLKDIKNNVDFLVAVVNGKLQQEGKQDLKKHADVVLQRENKGFDVEAYKHGIEYLNNETENKWDEVVMFNFTCFGPVYPFVEMFNNMSEKKLDFWGITKHYGMDEDPYHRCRYGCIPEHIQSSFIVVRKSLYNSKDFKKYWENMTAITDYVDAIVNHEAVFTKHFNDLGYKSDVYVQTDDLKNIHPYPLMMMPLELIKNRKCPIFKRKTFYNYYDEYLDVSIGNQARELYDYLKDSKIYDCKLIWDNLLRTCNMYDLKERLHLNYILESEGCFQEKEYNKRIALMMHIYFDDRIEYCMEYASNMPKGTDIWISTDSQKKKENIERVFSKMQDYNVNVRIAVNRGRDVSALLVCLASEIEKYDLICFVHDKKAYQSSPYIIGENFATHCFENTLASKRYVHEVIELFNKEESLGMLVPTPPYHGPYFKTIGNEWSENYDEVVKFMKKNNISVEIDEKKPVTAPYGTCFWFRKEALMDAVNLKLNYEDFSEEPIGKNDGDIMHVIERMYPIFAQNAGYYSAWVMTRKNANCFVTNFHHYLRDYNVDLFERFGVVERDILRSSIKNPRSVKLKHRIHAMLGEKTYTKIWQKKEALKNRLNNR